jgi:hypothetical protein
MELTEVYRQLGSEAFFQLLRGISIGRLKTYKLFERIKARTHLHKLNTENLRKAAPKLWLRIEEHDQDLATDLAQAILICQMDMIRETLDFLGVPHEEGFFAKDLKAEEYLKDNWRERAFEGLKDKFPRPVLLFYLNHLAWEVAKAEDVYLPAA